MGEGGAAICFFTNPAGDSVALKFENHWPKVVPFKGGKKRKQKKKIQYILWDILMLKQFLLLI